MQSKFCFYIHHHGSGHVMRAIAIAKAFPDEQITFMGSDLGRYKHHMPNHVSCIHLPIDIPDAQDHNYRDQHISFLHYSPLQVSGLVQRNALMVDFFRENPKVILIVDVSVEVTMLARLCGIPTVVIKQHGNRTDLPHRMAYESAELVIAPYSKMLDLEKDYSKNNKTFYSGGFSRYTGRKIATPVKQDIAIFIGQGGSNIDARLIGHIRQQIDPEACLHIIGTSADQLAWSNTYTHGHLSDPIEILNLCDVVICNAGHNTVMELADLRKKMICVPAARPFDEQVQKADYLERAGCAITLHEENLYRTDWKIAVNWARNLDVDAIKKLTSTQAISGIKNTLDDLYHRLYGSSSKQLTNA